MLGQSTQSHRRRNPCRWPSNRHRTCGDRKIRDIAGGQTIPKITRWRIVVITAAQTTVPNKEYTKWITVQWIQRQPDSRQAPLPTNTKNGKSYDCFNDDYLVLITGTHGGLNVASVPAPTVDVTVHNEYLFKMSVVKHASWVLICFMLVSKGNSTRPT